MISYLKGRVSIKEEEFVVLDTGSVGYKVFLAHSHLEETAEGAEMQVFCFFDAREGRMSLYGVRSWEALKIFEKVNEISGIGPKTALELSSFGTVGSLKKAVEEKGLGVFEGMKGIGAKRQQKILFELTGMWEQEQKKQDVSTEDAIRGLMSLGFSRKQSKEALSQISPDIVQTEEQIKEALKTLGSKAAR